ncbi:MULTISPECIES: asparaginase [Paracoccus]|jgi:L-asparaginase|uniref:asparaginase n=1 Tax=Paracoccus TaxID=265 RepID=UPI0025892EC0|nr:asparaginase [Paracoccus sp. (in: a-proteobacteria)]
MAPRIVALVSTGGTIASRFSADHGGLFSMDGPEALLVPGLPTLRVDPFCNLGSNRIDLALSLRLAQRIAAHLADPDVAGCVVTHGTDTMEESAFLASRVIGSEKPVVFTGAQFAADSPAPDGPGNLAAALRLAASRKARGLGVVVVFDGSAYAAEDVTKIDAQARAGFAGPHFGPVARIGRAGIRLLARPPRPVPLPAAGISPDVALLPAAMGMDGRSIDALVAAGMQGIVIEGFGCGNGTPELVAAVARVRSRGVTCVVTTRCLRGETRPLYADGGALDLQRAGAILAGRLQGKKARILLALLLAGRRGPVTARDFGHDCRDPGQGRELGTGRPD